MKPFFRKVKGSERGEVGLAEVGGVEEVMVGDVREDVLGKLG